MSTQHQINLETELRRELNHVRRELEGIETTIEEKEARASALREQIDAIRTVLGRLRPEDPDAKQASAGAGRAAADREGPTAIAVRLATANGGLVKVTDLSEELVEVGRYTDKKRAYSTAHAVLRQSPRFSRGEPGMFRDEWFGKEVSE